MHFNYSNNLLSFKRNISIYLIGLITVSVACSIEQNQFGIGEFNYLKYFYPLIGNLSIFLAYNLIFKFRQFSYFIFFITAIALLFNLSTPMTGAYLAPKSTYLFGLSFYTLSLAYRLYTNKDITIKDVILVSNPLVLFTGPVLTFYNRLNQINFRRRINYYFPFFLVGLFFFKVIAYYIVPFLSIIKYTSVPFVLIHAILFEIFIYFNFAGLSLLIFGIYGILGVEIPLNFRQPFSSKNLIEFWKSWHVSLSTVLKELIYKKARQNFSFNIAIVLVFLCSALWHGVSYNFLIWGLFHSLCYLFSVFCVKKNINYLAALVLIFAIPFGRILFAESNFNRLLTKLKFCDFSFNFSVFTTFGIQNYIGLFLGFMIILFEIITSNKRISINRDYKFLRIPITQVIIFLLFILLVSNSNGISFAAYGQR
jgi:D-alanyl-lipoteichoic acid acyltransferase DltB (MBOAT superfamily)